eukprot:m.150947 g.150947  ORF g.150947 m.150947 type:complete len:191 (-) comp24488_c1_seq3:246-818(-)
MGLIAQQRVLFKSFTKYGHTHEVRMAAADCLLDLVNKGEQDMLNILLDIATNDPDIFMRYKILNLLCVSNVFSRKSAKNLDSKAVIDVLWKIMNEGSSYDSRVRCAAWVLYSSIVPSERLKSGSKNIFKMSLPSSVLAGAKKRPREEDAKPVSLATPSKITLKVAGAKDIVVSTPPPQQHAKDVFNFPPQ